MKPRPLFLECIVAGLLAAGLAGGWLGPARAGDDHDLGHDHDRARAARDAGQVLPLAEILERVRREFPGEVIDIELEKGHHGHRDHPGGNRAGGDDDREQARLVYEIKLRTAEGRIVKLVYDAGTGALLARKWR